MTDAQMSKKLNKLFVEERWVEAKELILFDLIADPNDHWLWTRLSSTFYEQQRYKEALKYVSKAYKLCHTCPLVKWDLASTLYMLDQNYRAKDLYNSIITMDTNKLGRDACGEGLKWAKKLQLDCSEMVNTIESKVVR